MTSLAPSQPTSAICMGGERVRQPGAPEQRIDRTVDRIEGCFDRRRVRQVGEHTQGDPVDLDRLQVERVDLGAGGHERG